MRPDDRPLTIPEGPGAFVTLAEKRASDIRRGALDALQNSAAYPDAILRDLAHKGGLANFPTPQRTPETPLGQTTRNYRDFLAAENARKEREKDPAMPPMLKS
jgi:hypothetical protein